METLKSQEISLINKNESEIIANYNQIFRQNRNKLVDIMEDIIHNYMRGFPITRVEDHVDSFLDEMQGMIQRQAREIAGKLYDNYRILINNLEKDAKNNIDRYLEGLNEILKGIDYTEANEIFKGFIRGVVGRLIMYCDPFSEITSYDIESMIDEMRHELNRYLAQEVSKMISEGAAKTREVLIANYQKTEENVKQYQLRNKEVSEEEIERFKPVITNNNYEIVNEDGKYYIKDLETSKKYKFTIKDEALILEGNKIVFLIDGDNQIFTNEATGKRVVSSVDRLTTTAKIKIGDKESVYERVITKTSAGYSFAYNGKVYTDEASMLIVVEDIKKEVPHYYEELLKDKDFSELVSRLEQKDKENTEIDVNKETGEIKINPDKLAELHQKFRIMGYELFEIEGEYYLKDLTTGEERKMVASKNKWGVGLEGLSPKELNITTNITFVGKNDIVHGMNKLQKGDMSLTFRSDSKFFSLTTGEKTYYIIKQPEGYKYIQIIDDKESAIEESEMLAILEEKMPYLAEHIEKSMVKEYETSGPIR